MKLQLKSLRFFLAHLRRELAALELRDNVTGLTTLTPGIVASRTEGASVIGKIIIAVTVAQCDKFTQSLPIVRLFPLPHHFLLLQHGLGDAEKLMVLLIAQLELENLVPIRLDPHNVDLPVLVHNSPQLELRHEPLDHLEVHNPEQKIIHVLRHRDSLLQRLILQRE